MSQTLSSYLLQVRRLLHDANGDFWSDQQLTDAINAGRKRLVRDTGCLRSIQSSATVVSQETYPFSGLPQGAQTMDVLNVNIFWGNTRIPLRYLPWTDFNARLRYWQNYIGRPIAFSMYGPQTIYLGPVPDMVYQMEVDTILLPVDLVNTTDVDSIPDPWTDPVPYYAAHVAKYQEQSYGEAEIFLNLYRQRAASVNNTTFTRRIPDPYSIVG